MSVKSTSTAVVYGSNPECWCCRPGRPRCTAEDRRVLEDEAVDAPPAHDVVDSRGAPEVIAPSVTETVPSSWKVKVRSEVTAEKSRVSKSVVAGVGNGEGSQPLRKTKVSSPVPAARTSRSPRRRTRRTRCCRHRRSQTRSWSARVEGEGQVRRHGREIEGVGVRGGRVGHGVVAPSRRRKRRRRCPRCRSRRRRPDRRHRSTLAAEEAPWPYRPAGWP